MFVCVFSVLEERSRRRRVDDDEDDDDDRDGPRARDAREFNARTQTRARRTTGLIPSPPPYYIILYSHRRRRFTVIHW